jgi:hypothetical protein
VLLIIPFYISLIYGFDMKRIYLKSECKSGVFIKDRYIKCPHLIKKCCWRMDEKHISGYSYLDNACYLSGSFKLECPE